jgi:acetoin utilization deacetylase AcuC-like enzyme
MAFLVHDSVSLEHDTGNGHPESSERITAILDHFERADIFAKYPRIPARRATVDEITMAHDPGYYRKVKGVADRNGSFDGDTPTGGKSLEAAEMAAGSLLAAADEIMAGTSRRGFCLVRPPGHHATRSRAMGFCLFNSIAICARYLRQRHGLDRVAIIDFDVHHGNGTEDIFSEDPSTFFLSLHRYPFYPGTGGPYRSGRPPAANRNIPLPAHTTPADYLAALDHALLEVAAHRPEIILISAGFDAHINDPIGGLNLSTGDFEKITKRIVRTAEEHADGRIISTLEGGYGLSDLGPSVEAHLSGLGD